MKVWSKLWHPNVVEFMGFLTGEAGAPVLVSRWMENGTALDYVKKHPDADISSLVCIFPHPLRITTHARAKVLGIGRGLEYLHYCNVVHSDIKSVSIFLLVNLFRLIYAILLGQYPHL